MSPFYWLSDSVLLHFVTVYVSPVSLQCNVVHLFGTISRNQFEYRRHCQFSAVSLDWRLTFLLCSLTAHCDYINVKLHCSALITAWLVLCSVTCRCSLRKWRVVTSKSPWTISLWLITQVLSTSVQYNLYTVCQKGHFELLTIYSSNISRC